MKDSFDTAVFTTKFVLEDQKLITYVSHELEDGAWQFFSDDEFENFEEVAKVIGLEEIFKIDPTLKELKKLEVGYCATRTDKKSNWIINRIR